jgi:hypothetical protein
LVVVNDLFDVLLNSVCHRTIASLWRMGGREIRAEAEAQAKGYSRWIGMAWMVEWQWRGKGVDRT